MKIILTTDVANLGHATNIVTVKNGYARNFLLPQGLAIPYSDKLVAEIEKMQAEREKQREEILANIAYYADQISKIRLEFTEKASNKGVLYGSVTSAMIVAKLVDEHKITLNPEDIEIPDGHIKATGKHKVVIKLGNEKVELGVEVKTE